MDKDDKDWMRVFKDLGEGILVAQAWGLAARLLAGELVVDLAKSQPDPDRYLTALYDRVIVRLDPEQAGDFAAKPCAGQARDELAAILRDVRLALGGGSPPAAPADPTA